MSGHRPPATPRPTGGPGITRFATRDGHRLSYESIGAADGVPILALHDLLADRGQLRPLADVLPPDRYRLTLPDARGHGASPTISGRAYAADELAADALAVIDAEGIAQAHIAAVGWGAGTALGMALLAPERIASIVLAELFLPSLTADDTMLETLRQAADAAGKGHTDRALDLYLGMRLDGDWRDRLPKARLGAMRRAAGNLAPLLTGAMDSRVSREDLSRLEVPVMLLGSAESPDADPIPAARIGTLDRDALPGAPAYDWLPAMARAFIARAEA